MHYDARKHLLEYDDVANDQRKVVYQLRDELMGTEDVKERYENIRDGVISDLFFEYISPKVLEADWDIGGLESALALDYSSDIPVQKSIDEGLNVDQVLKMILEGFMVSHKVKETAIGSETMRTFEKAVMLKALDHHWKDHLAVMDQLRQSVNLRGYGQKNPVQEYKRESFSMFTVLLDTINSEMVKALCSLNLEQAKDQLSSASSDMEDQETNSPSLAKKPIAHSPRITRQPSKLKVGRNDPCPCGSGKKYKQCHG